MTDDELDEEYTTVTVWHVERCLRREFEQMFCEILTKEVGAWELGRNQKERERFETAVLTRFVHEIMDEVRRRVTASILRNGKEEKR